MYVICPMIRIYYYLGNLFHGTRVSDPKEARMVESFKGEGFQFHSEGHHVIRRVESPLNFGQSNNDSIKRRSRRRFCIDFS